MSVVRILVLFLISYNIISAQITSAIRFDKDSTGLGEPLMAEITISVPASCNPVSLKLFHPDSVLNLLFDKDTLLFEKYADWEILDAGIWNGKTDETNTIKWSESSAVNSNGIYTVKNILKITFYSAGLFSFQPPEVQCENPTEFIRGKSVEILIVPPLDITSKDSVQLRPIRPIYTEPLTAEDLIPWIAGILIALLLFSLWYFIWRKRKKVQKEPISIESTILLLPHETAFKALSELKQKKLWQQGQIKEYQSELTYIIRRYLEERFQIPALEMTTPELRQNMYSQGLNETEANQLYEILSVADLVKFAKATPEAEIHEKFLDMAFDFVEKTKTSGTES